MKWSANNRACKTVWSTLMVLDQIGEDQSFDSTGKKTVGNLRFFPHDGSQDIIDIRAKSLAIQIDKVFRMIRGATYENNVSQSQAVDALAVVLKDKEQTVAELANKADDQYLFFKEGE